MVQKSKNSVEILKVNYVVNLLIRLIKLIKILPFPFLSLSLPVIIVSTSAQLYLEEREDYNFEF